jgi:calcium channel MID1
VPLPAPPEPNVAYDSTNLPTKAATTFVSYMANFTTVLTTFACGRDWYSPLVGCEDCQREYRKWLCAISFTRCSEPSPANPNAFTAVPASPSVTGLSASRQTDASGAQIVLSALLPQQTSDQRNQALPALGSPYNMLLPCLEMCNAVDRSCPPFLQFTCPTNQFNAAASYGVGYIDGADGSQNEGLTGDSQDRWGNVWCHNI